MRTSLLLVLITFSAVSLATPPDNRPPDNRPPGHDGGGVTTNSNPNVTSDVVNDVVNNVTSDVVNDVANAATANINTGGTNTNVSHSSKALALGNSLGDVDINDCRESVQFGTPVFSKQNVRLNPWCAAEVYDAKGMFKMAAIMRCDIKDVRKHFASDEECIAANELAVPVVAAAPPPPPEIDRDEVEDAHEDLERRLKEIEDQRARDARRAAAWAKEQREARAEQKRLAQESLEALAPYRNDNE